MMDLTSSADYSDASLHVIVLAVGERVLCCETETAIQYFVFLFLYAFITTLKMHLQSAVARHLPVDCTSIAHRLHAKFCVRTDFPENSQKLPGLIKIFVFHNFIEISVKSCK